MSYTISQKKPTVLYDNEAAQIEELGAVLLQMLKACY